MRLPGTTTEFWNWLRKKMRSNIARGEKRLQARAGLSLTCRRVSGALKLPEVLQYLERLHKARQVKKGNKRVFAYKPAREFLELVVADFPRRDWLRLYLWQTGTDVVATMLWFKVGRRMSYRSGGYDLECADASPGTVLIAQVLRSASAEDCAEFDFAQGNEGYKALWTDDKCTDRRNQFAGNAVGASFVRGLLLKRNLPDLLLDLWRQHRRMTSTQAAVATERDAPA